jgi:RHS repeat-associated protein
MFTGRQFDIETGLYYYRARYYNPYLGRFLQTDPVGYGYGYCANNPLNFVDPSGLLQRFAFLQEGDPGYIEGSLRLALWTDGHVTWTSELTDFSNLTGFYTWAAGELDWIKDISLAGWTLSQGNPTVFLAVKALEFLNVFSSVQISLIEDKGGWRIIDNSGKRKKTIFGNSANGYIGTTIYWDPGETSWQPLATGTRRHKDKARHWHTFPAEAALAHEMGHAYEVVTCGETCQPYAIMYENAARWAFYYVVPEYIGRVWPRPLTGDKDLDSDIEWAWKRYNSSYYLINHWIYHRRR